MTTGANISITAHAALLLFIVFGGWFTSNRLPPVDVADVTVLTEEEYQALVPPAEAPDFSTDVAALQTPDESDVPEMPEEDAVPEQSNPSAPEALAPPPLAPNIPETPDTEDANVLDTAPVLDLLQQGDELVPVVPDAVPRPAERVAPEAAPPPPLDVVTAPEIAPDIATDAPEIAEASEESEAAAPEEATTELLTEADESSTVAPIAASRPPARPTRQVAESAPEDVPTPLFDIGDVEAARDAAVAAAATGSAGSQRATRPRGTPMTAAEEEAFRLSVQRCWNVDIGSAAAEVTVVIAFSLTPDGKVVQGSLRQIAASEASANAVSAAYEAARRAILRCGASGFDLPREKYAQWQNVELTFDIEEMGR